MQFKLPNKGCGSTRRMSSMQASLPESISNSFYGLNVDLSGWWSGRSSFVSFRYSSILILTFEGLIVCCFYSHYLYSSSHIPFSACLWASNLACCLFCPIPTPTRRLLTETKALNLSCCCGSSVYSIVGIDWCCCLATAVNSETSSVTSPLRLLMWKLHCMSCKSMVVSWTCLLCWARCYSISGLSYVSTFMTTLF